MGRGMFDFPFNPKKCKIMKFANISKATRVPASLKFAALAAILLVPASAFAETDSSANSKPAGSTPTAEKFRVVPYRAPGTNNSVEEKSSLSIKVFYARALESSYKEYDKIFGDTDVDLGGLTVEYTKRLSPKWSSPIVDFVAALSVGGGSCDGDYTKTTYYAPGSIDGSFTEYSSSTHTHGEVSIFTVEAEIGVNLTAPLNDSFSLFVGPRLGMNLLRIETELTVTGSRNNRYENDAWASGLLYGIDAGVVFSLNETNALMLGAGYRASTAQRLDIEKQSWLRFSVGYRFSF